MAASVVIGQIYVGTGYRSMNKTMKDTMNYLLWTNNYMQHKMKHESLFK